MHFPETQLRVGDTEIRLAYARRFPGAGEDWYWASLWPSAMALSTELMEGESLSGVRVLELGCGCGLAGIAAGRRGGSVTVTDVMPEALELAAANWRRNGMTPERTEVLDWRNPPSSRTYDLILGADILYRPSDFQNVIRTLQTLMAPGGCAWIAEPGRPAANEFFARMLQAGYAVDTRHRRVNVHDAPVEVGVSRFQ